MTGVRTAVVVAPSPVPIRLGGAERHWEALRAGLEDAGVAVDLVKLPVREFSLVDLLDAYEAFRLLDLSHADLVITGKYPAWMVQHPNHVVWMLHPLRGLYDTWNAASHEHAEPQRADAPTREALSGLLGLLGGDPRGVDPLALIDAAREAMDRLGPEATEPGGCLALPGPLARAIVHHLDHWALDRRRVSRHLAISSVVAGRRDYFPPGVRAEVLIPPSCLPEPTATEVPAGAGYLAVGRLERPKRIDLAIEAFARVEDPAAQLTVVGDGADRARLGELAAGDGRVRFTGRVSDARLAELYRDARAVLVTPEQEDFGYVAIEAMQAGRPVVTTVDSGGPAELLTDGEDALVVEADPAAIASALRSLDDDALAQRLGKAARGTAARHSWPEAISVLTSDPPRRSRGGTRRGRIAALSTYPVDRWPGGGPERARHLLGALAGDGWEVELVAVSPDGSYGSSELAPGFTEVRAPLSQRHMRAARRLRRLTANLAVSDITTSVLWPASDELVRAARFALEGADVVVAVQPYLAPLALELGGDAQLVYDAHNHETSLKSAMLPDDEAGRWMLQRVREAEALAVGHAALVVATTEEDARSLEAQHSLERGSVLVVPNGVDTATTRPAPPAERDGARRAVLQRLAPGAEPGAVALFVGSAHRPNADAAHEILTMAGNLPGVLFLLAGEHSGMLDAGHIPDNVVTLGRVEPEELEQLHAAADVALNPMRSGSGSNLKVLEYLAAGIPVVSTPTGARGIPDAEELLTVARIDRFEEALVEVTSGSLGDRSSGKLAQRARAAREMVESTFDWAVVARSFTESVQVLAHRGAGPR